MAKIGKSKLKVLRLKN